MSKDNEIMAEEILLGYLRTSKKIELTDFVIKENDTHNEVTYTFKVAKDFGSTLVNSLNNQFFDFFNKNNKQ